MGASTDSTSKDQPSPDRPRATGIGGIFFKCADPKKMNEWYGQHLGMETSPYGTNFEWRQADEPNKKGSTVWSPFPADSKYFEPSQKDYMINFRVTHIEELVEQLKAAGITVVDSIAKYDYGKFVHVLDPEGNKIELWEPIDEE